MSRHIPGACHDEDCPACGRLAEAIADGEEYSAADREREADWMADRAERVADERWAS
jgi:hypothetical protein